MAVLSDKDIRQYLKEGKIVLEGFDSNNIDSCSVDLTLSNKLRVFRYNEIPFIDTKEKIPDTHMALINVEEGKPIIVHPGELILASTNEYLKMPDDLVATLDGRSSLGRLGIVVHSTANSVDPGFEGNPTLEISNISKIPITLWPGMRICRLTFTQLSSPAEVPYNKRASSKYHQQKDPAASKISQDMENYKNN